MVQRTVRIQPSSGCGERFQYWNFGRPARGLRRLHARDELSEFSRETEQLVAWKRKKRRRPCLAFGGSDTAGEVAGRPYTVSAGSWLWSAATC